MKALVVESPRHAVFKDIPTPVPQGHEVLAKVVRAGICGTDNAIYTGDCSFVRDGLIKYPVRFGHEWSGVVEAVGSEDEQAEAKIVIGRRVLYSVERVKKYLLYLAE